MLNQPKMGRGSDAARSKNKLVSNADREAVKELGLSALSAIGSDGRVPLSLDDPIGSRVIVFGVSGSWTDSSTPAFDRSSPVLPMKLYFRIWLGSREESRRLQTEVPRILAGKTRKLRGDWYALNDDVSTEELHEAIRNLASAMGLQVLNDKEVLALLRDQPSAPDQSGSPAIN